MKKEGIPYFAVFFALVTFMLILIISNVISPNKIKVGPHETYFWSSTKIVSFPAGSYHFYSGSDASEPWYFQLNKENNPPVQASWRNPKPGEKYPKFYIDNSTILGDWKISSSAYVWTDEEVILVEDYTAGDKAFQISMISIIYILINFLLYLAFLRK
jgi:hypothetical protein